MVTKIISKLIPDSLLQILRKKMGVPSQESSFERLKKLGYAPQTILDIGAYEGDWTLEIKSIFPNAKILMVEAQLAKEEILLKKTRLLSGCDLKIALLGSEKKSINFNIYETASSVFEEDNYTGAKIETIDLQLLDEVVLEKKLTTVDFIKLDTQGYELEILKGGKKVLETATFVLIEVSFLNIYKQAPLADEVIFFMKNKGFLIYDICTLMKRPYDKSLYQADVLFIRADHPLRSSTRWS